MNNYAQNWIRLGSLGSVPSRILHLCSSVRHRFLGSDPNQILHQVSKEYIEAVVQDAIGIWRSYQDRQDTLVAINPRRIAVILDKQANRGAVLPVQLIEQVMDGSMRTGLQTWLESPPARFFVTHLSGSWFARH